MFAAGLLAASVVVVHAAAEPDLAEVSGTVVASCETLQARPMPEVSTVQGGHLDGEPYLGIVLGTGPCRAGFRVAGVARQRQYRVTIGPMSTIVDEVTASGSVKLVEP